MGLESDCTERIELFVHITDEGCVYPTMCSISHLSTQYRMRFNFNGVYILQICNFRVFAFLNSRLLGTVVLKYSWVKYSWIYGVIAAEVQNLLDSLLDSFEDVIVSNG